MDVIKSTPAKKRPYTRPKLTPISLYGGEVLGIGCKSYTTLESPAVAVGGGTTYGCGLAVPCYEAST